MRKRSPTASSVDVVLNILARQRDPGPPATILTPVALTLRHAPVADCARYDNLRSPSDRTTIFELIGQLKLYGMKDAFDETRLPPSDVSMSRGASSATCSRPRSARAGALDRVPAHHRQAAACQGPR